jgi:Sel1 repeat
MYQKGIGTEPNDQKACCYWQLAAEGGDLEAQFFLGYSYWHGNGVKNDQEQALFWLEKAAENGSAQANHLLSEISDVDSSEIYLNRSAQSGNFLDKVLVRSTDKLDEKEFKTLLHKSIRKSFHLQVNDIILLDQDSKFLLIDTMILEGKAQDKYKALSAIQSMAEENCVFSLRRLARFYLFWF